MTGSYRSAFFHCASEVIGDEQLRYAAQGRSGNGCGHLTMTSCPDLRTLQRRYSWTPPITATKIATRRISPVSGLITGTVGPQKSIKSFSPARCSLAHGETSRFFFPLPVATAEVRVSHRFVTRLCLVFHPQQLPRHTLVFSFPYRGTTCQALQALMQRCLWAEKMSFSSVSWDISAGNGHDREEALKRARTSKNG